MTTFETQLKKQQKSLIKLIFSNHNNSQNNNDILPHYQNNITIYQHSFFSRILSILTTNYPASSALIGPSAFEECVKNYLSNFKPNHYNINYIGHGFFRFLKHIQYHKKHPLFVDLLLFEKRMFQLRNTINDKSLKSHYVLSSHYPVGQIWYALVKKTGDLPSLIYRHVPFHYIFYKKEGWGFFTIQTLALDKAQLKKSRERTGQYMTKDD